MTSLTPLKFDSKLAPTPTSNPKYSLSVTNNSNSEDTLADPKCTRALVALMNQHAVIGGAAAHWGGPAAFAEIMSSVHAIMFKESSWFDTYNFVNDAGHAENGVYALRANYGFDGMSFESLRGFRSIDSKLTGHGEAHLNPEGVFISNGPLGSGVPQAQGLALADKLLGNARTTICAVSDGASMEGEAKESFAAIPGLAHKGKLNPFVLLISNNNTKLSGRIEADSFAMNPTFESLEVMGWDVRWVDNGHDLNSVHLATEKAILDAGKNSKKPVAVVYKTIKGFGNKATEESASGGHGYPLKAYDARLPEFLQEIYDGKAPEEFLGWADQILKSKPEAKAKAKSDMVVEKVQPGFSRATIRAAKEGLPVYSISADCQGSTGMAPFQKEFPDRYLDIGIAESNMVSAAVGMSKQGLIPIVDTFAQFGITKGNLPLIMAALSQGPVISVFSHAGFQDAADGASHQATTFISAVSGIPHTQVLCVTSSEEAESYMYQAIKHFETKRSNGEIPDNIVFFLGRENYPASLKKGLTYDWGKPQLLKEGTDVTLVGTGSLVCKALLAAEALEKEGISAAVVNHPFVNNPDVGFFKDQLSKTKNKLITIEDHQLIGGMAAQLIHSLKTADCEFQVRSLGNPGIFGQSAYMADQLYAKYGMDEVGVVAAAKEIL